MPSSPKPTPEQKLRIASRLYQTARKVKLAALRHQLPAATEEDLRERLNQRFFLLRD